ncbi:ABC transporter substrate-binding protein [Streptomyces sp. TS71-3]|uniref:ABC transporter substrate-binding protein n=1 Tax=Streptomyces sp. TS71-3 TaxID=2733862 RepID=UPI001B0629CF|nr:extracellular solute-binding protein [Streptomyces sp. TS71-3]GHJ39340.1 lipoprotein [Streptomyces sp. TS71-3]
MTLSNRNGRAFAAAAAVSALLAGCSTPSNDSALPAAGAPVAGSLQMSYWGSSTRVEKTDRINALFERKYPKASVQTQVGDFATYFDKLNVQAASSSMPCVTGLQTRQLNDYTHDGLLQPLDPLVASGAIDVGSIPKNLLDTGRGPDGKLYMVPYGAAWNALMVDQEMARRAGVKPLPMRYSWTDFVSWLKDAKSKLPAGVAPTTSQGGNEPVFSAYVIGSGEKMFDDDGKIAFSKKTLTEYWKLWEHLREAGLTNSAEDAADEPAQPEQFYVTTGKVLSEPTAGNALVAASAAAPDEHLTTVPFPTGSAGLGNAFFNSGWSIPARCGNKATAAAYIDFFTNDDRAAAVYDSDNGAVANRSQLKQQLDRPSSPALQQELQVYDFILGEKVPQPLIPSGYNTTFEQAFTRGYENIEFGRKSISQAVDDFFAEAEINLGTR